MRFSTIADLLIELALLLAHVGDVDGLERRRHISQNVAGFHDRAKLWGTRLRVPRAGR